jgi:hypothetical protein
VLTYADKFDWCCDWLDSPNIKDDLTAKMEEYGGPVLAWKYMTKDAPDCLAKFRTHKLAGPDPEQDRVGAAGTVPGSELEAYMKRIVFRLDAINDQLESFALFRNMRGLKKCVENCRQLARNAGHNVDMLEFSSMAEPLEWTNAAEYREEEQVDILEQAEVALGLEQVQGRPQGSPTASQRASPIEFQNTLNVPTSNSPVNFNSVGKIRKKATYAFPEESQESVEHGSEQGLPGASQRGSPVEFQPVELQNTRNVPRRKGKNATYAFPQESLVNVETLNEKFSLRSDASPDDLSVKGDIKPFPSDFKKEGSAFNQDAGGDGGKTKKW